MTNRNTCLGFLLSGCLFLMAIAFSAENTLPVTSMKQLSDVPREHPHYEAIESLAERYRVLTVTPDQKFNPEQELTWGEFSKLLESALGQMMMYMLSRNTTDADGVERIMTHMGDFDPNNTSLTSVTEVTGLESSSEYYVPVQVLIERYGIIPVSQDKKFEADKLVTEKELNKALDETFLQISKLK